MCMQLTLGLHFDIEPLAQATVQAYLLIRRHLHVKVHYM